MIVRHYLNSLKNAPVIWVDPEDLINQHSLPAKDVGIDLSGDWDKLGNSIKDGIIYKSFKARLEGAEWKHTKLYKTKHKLGKRWTKKLKVWDRMIKDIVNDGYTHKPIRDYIDSYISILIGRDGDMFIYNGIHRLVCCLLSKVKKQIPVKVLLRHSEWARFKRNCIAYQVRRGKLYCQLPHPDLEAIPYYWTNERAELIAKHSINQGGNVLDCGSHWGTTSYILNQSGFIPTAVERSLAHYKRAKKVSKIKGSSYEVIHGNIFDISTDKYETVVLLNLAHHFLMDKNKQRKFVRFLNNLSASEIFYQAHKEGDKWDPIMHPIDYLHKIARESSLGTVKQLADFNGRRLYQLIG